ncbi:hypothetical protein FHR71_005501 [Methylobacterium sp. RAS18]|nr:hypothetical protein [Methylobacterium sp. RAS18]
MAKGSEKYDVEVIFRMFEILRASGKAKEFSEVCKGRFKITLEKECIALAKQMMEEVVPDLIERRPGYMSDVLGKDARVALKERQANLVVLSGGGNCWACP